MERTLYLKETPGLRVSRDGPSLWVTRPHTAGQRVPVRLIRRVLIAGNVTLDAEALTVFAQRGVPITLLDRDGLPVAHVWSAAPAPVARRGAQAAALENPEVRERLAAMVRAWERGRRLVLASRLDPAVASRWRREGLRSEDYDAWIVRQARTRGAPLRRRGVCRAVLATLALEAIAQAGWDPHLGVLHGARPLGFMYDCTTALGAEADRLWLDSEVSDPSEGEAGLSRTLAALVEQHRPRLSALLNRLLSQYATRLWEP